MAEERKVLLSLREASVTFKKFVAVNKVSFDIYEGETFALVGESGSGKTTVGRAIVRINPLSNGEIIFDGKRISGKLSTQEDRDVVRNIQMIFQDPAASLNERATIDYIVTEGIINFHLYKDEEERLEKARNAIESVGLLPEHLSRYPHEFSGGQRQRIGIARSIIMEPRLIVADEPISALDVSIRAQVLNLLKKFQRERKLTYLFIAHDLSVVRFISDRIAVIHKGKIVELAESEALFNNPIHPYTRSLLSAIPLPDPQLEREKVLFVYRPEVEHDYSVEEPSFVEVLPGHFVLANSAEVAKYQVLIGQQNKVRAAEEEALSKEVVAAPVEDSDKPKRTRKAAAKKED